jgi:hypothetical protein
MKHFRYPGQEQEKRWAKATYKTQKAANSVLPRPLSVLTALISFYLIRRRTEYEKHHEIANAYIAYLKACSLRYILITSSYRRRKAKEKKSLKEDMLRAALGVHSCKKCGAKKTLDSLKISIDNGKVEYECKQCPSSKGREDQRKRKSEQRTNHKQRGVSLNYYRKVLGLENKELTKETITKKFREKTKEVHPDQGGSREEFLNIKEARDELLKHV